MPIILKTICGNIFEVSSYLYHDSENVLIDKNDYDRALIRSSEIKSNNYFLSRANRTIILFGQVRQFWYEN